MNIKLNTAIKKILVATSFAAISATTVASVGIQMPPPGPGQIPDYFGVVPNYAESPAPVFARVTVTGRGTGAVLAATTYDYVGGVFTPGVADVQVVNGGSGYDNTTVVTVSGAAGVSPVTVTPIIVNGAIVGIQEFDQFTRNNSGVLTATANTASIRSTSPNTPYLGSGFTKPIAGTGIRKFVDALPGLALADGTKSSYTNGAGYTANKNGLGQLIPQAIPDTTTFTGSDYYVIGLVEYTQKLHTDLPPTHLRGYVQLDANNQPMGTPQYLGPIIVAQKDRPVRVKMVNLLSKSTDATGPKGNLTVPVDVTYMGANETFNRSAMHLHGGNTPYISDGTPRQWVKPKGDATGTVPADGTNVKGAKYNKGVSAANVPDMWFDANGNLLSSCQGQVTCNVTGATNNPGDGALTFYFTNQQSARLMFYHDHAEGLTRLNVYAGVAAPYLLQDPTEQDLVNGTSTTGVNPKQLKLIPSIADTIPLVIQEKTFVPNDNIPVINAFGAFKSQLNAQDSTWGWGAAAAGFTDGILSGSVADVNGTGDLWVPHVYMPNQNPGDITGANGIGRADYGPWFWPPFTGVTNNPNGVLNPYYDAACVSAINGYCEGKWIPGVPNGNNLTVSNLTSLYNAVTATSNERSTAVTAQKALHSPSGTPEAFNDTPLVNGTVYPYINVDPKQYRLRILSIADDRALNLSLVVAASKNSPDTTAAGNAGANNGAIMCDGTTSVQQADCTEVRMVPFDSGQNSYSPFPAHTDPNLQDNGWYTAQNGGISFDGRPSGVFDPNTRGPSMVQIGVDGGFLSSPVQIYNKPVNFEYNLKNIVVTNVKEHALLLGPAERADVVVDFSNFAGSTLLLYNDNPAPIPAFDLRLDYYTGDFDNTDTGGTFSTVPGYGPNSRTLMQIRVAPTCVTGTTCTAGAKDHQDDLGTINMTELTKGIQTAFKTSQKPIIVPQASYNSVYGTAVNDATGANLSLISSTSLTYKPLDPVTQQVAANAVTLNFQPKSIIEDWTTDWGRMNALLGVELPKTSALTNTASPMSYIDPPTELVKITPNDTTAITGTLADGTQLWKVTHNGVDTHAIHFHLFDVQLINRVGWDGGLRPVELNEMGWKDIIRMNPLEDVVVALRPKLQTLPFKLPNSHHLLDPTKEATADPTRFYNLDPTTSVQSNVTNLVANYGYEYLWHCHILGHEENDMMRAIAVATEPEAPSMTSISLAAKGLNINWVDNSMTSNWVLIERSTTNAFTKGINTTSFTVIQPECTSQTGCARTYNDTTAVTGLSAKNYYYRVTSYVTVGAGDGRQDQGYKADGTYNATLQTALLPLLPGGTGFTGYGNTTAYSATSNVVSTLGTASVNPSALDFGLVVSGQTSPAKTVTLTNFGASNLTLTGAPTVTGAFAVSATTCSSGQVLAPAATCTISVVYKPTTAGKVTGNLSVATGATSAIVTLTGDAPANPVISSTTLNTVAPAALTVNWSASSVATANPDTYQLQRATATTSGVLNCPTSGYANIGGTTKVLTIADTTLTAGTNYCYKVVATNTAGTYTSAAYAYTSPAAPAAPSAIATVYTSPTALNLSWVASSTTGVTGYDIQLCQATSQAACTQWTNVGTNVPLGTVAVNNLISGAPYVFQIRTSKVFTSAWVSGLAQYMPGVKLSTSSINFGNQNLLLANNGLATVNSVTPSSVTVTNVSLEDLTFINATLTNNVDFTATSTCAPLVAVGSNCSVNVNMISTTPGVKSDTLTLTFVGAITGQTVTQTVSISGTAVTPNIAPTLASALTNATTVTLNWTAPAVSGTYTYQVTRAPAASASTCPVSGYTNLGTPQSTLTATDTIVAGTGYCYQVVATGNATTGASNYSLIAPTAGTVPSAPTTATFTNVGPTSLTLNWVASASTGTSAATSYNVQSCKNTVLANCTWGASTVVNAPTVSANITGLTANTSYFFKIQSVNAVGANATWLVTSAKVTLANLGVPAVTGATPGLTTDGILSAALKWTNVPGATSYNVRWSNSSNTLAANGGSIVIGVNSGQQITITGIAANSPVYMQVQAVGANGVSVWSAITTTTVK